MMITSVRSDCLTNSFFNGYPADPKAAGRNFYPVDHDDLLIAADSFVRGGRADLAVRLHNIYRSDDQLDLTEDVHLELLCVLTFAYYAAGQPAIGHSLYARLIEYGTRKGSKLPTQETIFKNFLNRLLSLKLKQSSLNFPENSLLLRKELQLITRVGPKSAISVGDSDNHLSFPEYLISIGKYYNAFLIYKNLANQDHLEIVEIENALKLADTYLNEKQSDRKSITEALRGAKLRILKNDAASLLGSINNGYQTFLGQYGKVDRTVERVEGFLNHLINDLDFDRREIEEKELFDKLMFWGGEDPTYWLFRNMVEQYDVETEEVRKNKIVSFIKTYGAPGHVAIIEHLGPYADALRQTTYKSIFESDSNFDLHQTEEDLEPFFK